MIKVAKFGGSSVANAAQFQKVKQIIDEDPSRRFIITSACGKESHEDHKVTDLLFLCHEHRKYGVSYESIFEMIEQKYRRIKEELNLKIDLEKEFKSIRSYIEKDNATDYLVSRGEYLTGKCLAEYLGAKFVDATDLIYFHYDGSFDMEHIVENVQKLLEDKQKIVIPGFYGALPNGVIKIMSRGGSDITGALVAYACDASVYENWTDVNGFRCVDPRIVKDSVRIPALSYAELREMSYMGANVLHDDAVFPVRMKDIPINIRNTNDPSNPGTMILSDCTEEDRKNPPYAVTGITGRKDYTIVTFTESRSSTEVGFLRKVLKIFEDYNVSIESCPITVDTFSIICESEKIQNHLYEIVSRIQNEFKTENVIVEEHVALVAIVGRAMKEVPGVSGNILSEFGRNQINIKVINQCADELSIVVGVHNDEFEKAIQCLYNKFVQVERKTA